MGNKFIIGLGIVGLGIFIWKHYKEGQSIKPKITNNGT